MGEEKKVFTTLEEVKEDEAKRVAGGFAGSDKYTMAEYSEAGVAFEHNYWSKDRYYIRGVRITQDKAEELTKKYFDRGKRPFTDDELRLLDVRVP